MAELGRIDAQRGQVHKRLEVVGRGRVPRFGDEVVVDVDHPADHALHVALREHAFIGDARNASGAIAASAPRASMSWRSGGFSS